MNERIRKIAEQTIGANPKYAVAMIIASPELEKFAELLIVECADYANWYQANSRYTDIAKAIKQHFGVEE